MQISSVTTVGVLESGPVALEGRLRLLESTGSTASIATVAAAFTPIGTLKGIAEDQEGRYASRRWSRIISLLAAIATVVGGRAVGGRAVGGRAVGGRHAVGSRRLEGMEGGITTATVGGRAVGGLEGSAATAVATAIAMAMEGTVRRVGGRLEGGWRAVGGRLEGGWCCSHAPLEGTQVLLTHITIVIENLS